MPGCVQSYSALDLTQTVVFERRDAGVIKAVPPAARNHVGSAASGKMPPMTNHAETNGEDRATDDLLYIREGAEVEAPRRRWLTISRDRSYVHVYLGPRGTVSKGPATVLGASFHDLARQLGTGHGAVYPAGAVPAGYDRHPTYRAARVAGLPSPTPDEVARGLRDALEQEPLAPWVRAERQTLVGGARDALRHADPDIALVANGTVDAAMLSHVRDVLGLFPALYHALWRAAGYDFHVIGRSPRGLPEVAERELAARTRGAFIVNRQTAYVFVPNLRDPQDARSTAMEETAHGLDLILGVLHGLEGVPPGRVPAETVARSNQPDFHALWERRKDRTTISRRVRQDARELFANALVRYYTYGATMKKDDASLHAFVAQLQREVAAYVGPY